PTTTEIKPLSLHDALPICLKEEPGVNPDADTMIKNLLADHETIARELREDIDKADDEYDAADAADFLTSILEAHNKMAWMLRSRSEEHTSELQSQSNLVCR